MERDTRLAALAACLTFIFSLGSSALAQAPKGQGNDKADLILNLKPGPAGSARAKDLAKGFGKIVSGDARTGAYRLRLSNSVSMPKAMDALRQKKGVITIGSAELDDYDMNNVDDVKRKLADIKAGRYKGTPTNPRWLEGYLWYIEQRAYPNKTVDWDAYEVAMKHRDQMQKAPIGGVVEEGNEEQTINGPWTFMGPRNLDVPYTQYWGPKPVSGRISAIAYDPVDPTNVYYIGSGAGGVWKTTNAGASWTPLSDKWTLMNVGCIVIDPTNRNRIYVGTGDFAGGVGRSNGIMRSTNGGSTFTNVGNSTFGNRRIRRIIVDPQTPSMITVLTQGGPIYQSLDSGSTWNVSLNVNANWSGASVGIPDSLGRRAYYVVGGSNPPQVFRSLNRGATWTQLTPPVSAGNHGVLDIAASTANASRVYLLVNRDRKILKSTDRGLNWSDTTNNFPDGDGDYNWSQSGYDWHIVCSKRPGINGGSDVDVVYVGLIDLVQSYDAGNTWRSIGGPTYSALTAKTHNDQHAMVINPANPNEALVGNDGGIYRMTFTPNTNTLTYANLNQLLGVTQFWTGAWHPTSSTRMIGGSQDNATPVALGDTNNWDNVAGGDGGGAGIDKSNGNIQFATSQLYGMPVGGNNIGFWHTTNAWFTSFPKWIDATGDRIPFIGTLELTRHSPAKVYIGTNFLYRWEDNIFGGAWSPRLGNKEMSLTGTITAIGPAKNVNTRVYVGTTNGNLQLSSDSGVTWTKIDHLSSNSTTLPNRTITCIDPSPTNSGDILVTLSGTGGPHVYRCTSATSSSRTWTNVSGSGENALPDIPVNAITRDIDSPSNTWYVATDIGVFMTFDGGANWFNATAPLGLPNVHCNDIEAVPGTRRLNVATFGRGMWRINLSTTSPQLVSIVRRGTTTTFRPGDVFFADVNLSQMAPPGGTKVSLSANFGTLSFPSTVTVAAGQTSALVRFVVGEVLAPHNVTVTASLNGVSKTFTVSLTTR